MKPEKKSVIPSYYKKNTGTNLIVRMTLALANDGWTFVIVDDRVTQAYNESQGERKHFESAGALKKWMEEKAEDY